MFFFGMPLLQCCLVTAGSFLLPGPFLLSYSFLNFIFSLFFSFLGRALD